MVHKIEIGLCIFSIAASIISAIYSHYLQKKALEFSHSQNTIIVDEQRYLSELKTEKNPHACAHAFIGLLEIGYILIHTLKDKGNSYNDENQSDLYSKSLTQDTVNLLFSVEGTNEWDLF